MADTNLPVTPGTGTNVDGYGLDNGNFRQSVIIGDPVLASSVLSVDPIKGIKTQAYQIPADQLQTGQSASAAGLTVTLPAVASSFHYIVGIEITALTSVAPTANGTAINVTTTNLPNNPSWLFGNAPTLGNIQERIVFPSAPIKSSVAGTSTTIVAPAVASLLWRINVHYYVAP